MTSSTVPIVTYDQHQCPTDRVAKAKDGQRNTVCIPAHNEAWVIDPTVHGIGGALMGRRAAGG